jgi:heme o synthase
MVSQAPVSTSATAMKFSARATDFVALTKPEVNLLVLMATGAGYILALHGSFGLLRFTHVLVGTFFVASGTATLNQVMERQHDGEMRRTARRPLPDGRLRVREASIFGVGLSVLGTVDLWIFVNFPSAALALTTLLMYLLVYTPLKRKTAACTLIGAIPGAMPVLIGWTAVSDLNARAWLLFALLFLWQFPHFLAIALMYREDYERAGYRMLPRRDVSGRFTRIEIIGFSFALTITVFAFVVYQGWTAASMIMASLAGAFVLFYSIRLAFDESRVAASRLLHATVLHLPAVLGFLVAQKY